VAEEVVARLGLRPERAIGGKDEIRYVSAWFDDELTKLEGAERVRGPAAAADSLAPASARALPRRCSCHSRQQQWPPSSSRVNNRRRPAGT
jgi:hypothetical protein